MSSIKKRGALEAALIGAIGAEIERLALGFDVPVGVDVLRGESRAHVRLENFSVLANGAGPGRDRWTFDVHVFAREVVTAEDEILEAGAVAGQIEGAVVDALEALEAVPGANGAELLSSNGAATDDPDLDHLKMKFRIIIGGAKNE